MYDDEVVARGRIQEVHLLGRSARAATADRRAARVEHVQVEVVVAVGEGVEQREARVGRAGRHGDGVHRDANAARERGVDVVRRVVDRCPRSSPPARAARAAPKAPAYPNITGRSPARVRLDLLGTASATAAP
jgi:hypothetical protein